MATDLGQMGAHQAGVPQGKELFKEYPKIGKHNLDAEMGTATGAADVTEVNVLSAEADIPKTSGGTPIKDFMLDPNHPEFGNVDEHGRILPPWYKQLTVRSIALAAAIGVLFNLMVMKLGFTVGIIPSLNIAAGLLGFVGNKLLITILSYVGLGGQPFTRQENTVIQTCVVACYGLAFSGGFTNYLAAMTYNAWLKVEGSDTDGVFGQPTDPLPANVIQPSFGKYVAFMFTIYFIGIFALVPLRKVFVIDYRLTYPSGTATGIMVNGFHTPIGEAEAKQQVRTLGKWFTASFLWSFFKWFFSGFGDNCGFDNFPTLGFTAYQWTWYFDFSQTYVGIGMICPIFVTYSIMVGAIMSYGILWPIINTKAGEWFPVADVQGGSSSIQGLQGYKIFISVALILGDGLYNIVKITLLTIISLYKKHQAKRVLPEHMAYTPPGTEEEQKLLVLQQLRDKVFMKDAIPNWLAMSGYVVLAGISTAVVPHLFNGVKAYYVVVAYIIAPIFAFCNAYGMGLTDWSLLTTYGKIAIFIFAAWAGPQDGIVAGLAMCGVMATIVGSAADLMQDFKTGYLTLSSPRAMWVAQLCGAGLACVISPAVFWLYWTGFNIGDPNGEYPAPYTTIFRGIAVVAVEGASVLPKYCGAFCGAFFGFAVVVNAIRDFAVPARFKHYVPIPMAMAIPFYIGTYFAIDMTVGACILACWRYMDRRSAAVMAPIVASALIAGDGVWTVPSAILALAKRSPPICLWFFGTNDFNANYSDLTKYGYTPTGS